MRWFMWALGVVYGFTFMYGLHQFQLINSGGLLGAALGFGVLWSLLFVILRRFLPALSWRALVWNGVNLTLLYLLLAFYATDTSKYLN